MAIKLPQGLNITSTDPVDLRVLLTKEEMKSMPDATMPSVYLALCKDDGLLYIYNKSNSIDASSGKFRLYSAEVTEDELSIKLPGALAKALSIQADKDSGLVIDDDGNIKINVNPDELEIVNNQLGFAFDIIQSE